MSGSTYGYLVAFASATGGLLFGYEIGVIGQVLSLDTFAYDFKAMELPLRKNEKGFVKNSTYTSLNQWSTFIFLAGCALGAIMVSYLADSLGRKRTILASGLLFLIGAAGQTFAPVGDAIFTFFYGGRFIGGLGIGMASMCVPLYISETAPTAIRGRMITIQQLMITIGILVAAIVNAVIISVMEPEDGFSAETLVSGDKSHEWRYALSAQMVPAAFLVVIMFFMPESPRWLAMKDRNEEALTTLAKLQSLATTDSSIQTEYKDILDDVQTERAIGNGSWGELFSPGIARRTFITFFLQLFQQWTGINVIFYYGPQILQNMGLSKKVAQVQGSITNNVVNFLSTFPGMYFVESFGRRSLFIYGGIAMFVSQFIMTACLTIGNQKDTVLNIIALISVCTFTLGFGSTWGPCAWVYQSEVFPLRVRAKGTGLATFSNWANGALVSYLNPIILDAIPNQLFAVYGCMDVLATIFAYTFVPETAGKSLEDMEEIFGSTDSSLTGASLEAQKK
ncbi:general substrate transporter [Globomyces pollinis-pini]|nr:general substrate transporter [Globomyces pollinis-pini]